MKVLFQAAIVAMMIASVVLRGAQSGDAPSFIFVEPGLHADFCMPSTIRFSVEATDPDKRISRVEFLDGTNVLGSVSTPPYTLVLTNVTVSSGGHEVFARVIDKLGAPFRSEAHQIAFVNGPCKPRPLVSVIDGSKPGIIRTVFGTNNIVSISASTILDNNINPAEFFVDTNRIAIVPITALSVTVTNLSLGQHVFSVKVRDAKGAEFSGVSELVYVVSPPQIRPPGKSDQFTFSIIGLVPRLPIIIERSLNLVNWETVQTITPDTETIHYSDSTISQPAVRFYRVSFVLRAPPPAAP